MTSDPVPPAETAAAPEGGQSVTLVLPPELLARLRQQVRFDGADGLNRLLSDALSSYIHLGRLAANGAVFFAARSEDDTKNLVRLRFPFDPEAQKRAAGQAT